MKKLDNQGSTLIEVLVSMLIIMITATGGIALYFNSGEIKSLAIHKKIAAELANSQMEEFRNMAYDDSALTASTTGVVTRSDINIGGLAANEADSLGQIVTVTDTGLGYKKIQVDIKWNESGQVDKTQNITLVTYKRP